MQGEGIGSDEGAGKGAREGMTREGITREGMTKKGMTREGMTRTHLTAVYPALFFLHSMCHKSM